MEQGRNKKLLKDILIYGVGSLGAKLITFILFPVYTFFIAPDNLGYYDNSLAAIFLLMPIINMQLRDGVFRFLIDNKDECRRKDVINQSYSIIAIMAVVASLLFVGLSAFTGIRYGGYIFGLLLIMSFYEVQIQIVRGLGHTKLYVVCGILSALLISIFSIIFIVVLKWDIEGIFLANILARLFVVGFIELRLSVMRKYFSPKAGSKDTRTALLRYCCPLIMVVTFLWVIGSSHKFFIYHYMGLYDNGLFATALKFATIIEILSLVIFQAWQETSVLQLEAKDRDKYYSSVLSSYLLVLTGIVITLSFLLKTFYPMIVESKYADGAIFIYILCVAGIGYALQAFLSAIFQAKKSTMRMFYIAFASAVTSIALNYFFIKHIGLMGAAIAYALSFFFMFVYYLLSVQKIARIRFSIQTVIVSSLLLTGGGFIFYNTDNVLWRVLYWVICMGAIYMTLPKSTIHGAGKWILRKLKTEN